MDPEQSWLAEAQSQGLDNAHFLTINGTQLPFEDGEFDIVFTNKVTHHIPNWRQALAEMLRGHKAGRLLHLQRSGPAATAGETG